MLYFAVVAVLTGVTVGLFLHFTEGAISQLFRLELSSQPPDQELADDSKDDSSDWDLKWEAQLSSSTILEEEETSQSST